MHSLPVAVLSLLVGSGALAGAETMDDVTFSFASETFPSHFGPPIPVAGAYFSGVLPAMPQPVDAPFPAASGPGFWYNTNGLPFYEQREGQPGTSFDFYPGGVSLVPTAEVGVPRAYDYFTLANGGSLYSGPVSAPTLISGVYNAVDVVDIPGVGNFQLPGEITIAQVAAGTSSVPEPGSLGLVASGVLAMLGTWRVRRRVA